MDCELLVEAVRVSVSYLPDVVRVLLASENSSSSSLSGDQQVPASIVELFHRHPEVPSESLAINWNSCTSHSFIFSQLMPFLNDAMDPKASSVSTSRSSKMTFITFFEQIYNSYYNSYFNSFVVRRKR